MILFDGRDLFAEAHAAMNVMGRGELIASIFVAANRIGTLLKGDDYKDVLDAAVHINYGGELVFQTYFNALINNEANVSEAGYVQCEKEDRVEHHHALKQREE